MECDQHRAMHFHVFSGLDRHSSCSDPSIGKATSIPPNTVAKSNQIGWILFSLNLVQDIKKN
jgi:hypothetical protein